MHQIRIIVAARSERRRSQIASMLTDDEGLLVVAGVADQEAAAAASRTLPADVMLVAVTTPGEIDAADRLLDGRSDAPVVLLLENALRELARSRSGRVASSLLVEPVGGAQLRAALKAAATGLVVGQPHSLLPSAPGAGAEREESEGGRLTQREREVLHMIAEGLANKTIAYELGITPHTVKFHVASIMQKLGAASRTEAVTVGLRRGLIFL